MSLGYPTLGLLIGGQILSKTESIPVINPADENEIGVVPVADIADLSAAVAAASDGLRVWRRTPPAERARIMLQAAALVRERAEQIAAAITLEQGKPLAQARAEVGRAADIVSWDAGEGRRLYGQVIPAEEGMTYTTVHEPVGVVAAFSPWNFPIATPARKIAGALAAGCAIILKPSEETPAGAWLLAQAFVDAGVPAGVVNVVYGRPAEISEYLIRQPSVRMITLTGSVPVGKQLAALAGAQMKPAVMELGGHAPVIVCEDVDPLEVAEKALIGKSLNAGQVCVSPTRFLVAEPVFEAFTAALAERAAQLRIGEGSNPDTQLGPVANARRLGAVRDLLADAASRGGRQWENGTALPNSGYFHPLTVVSEVPRDARIMNEEPFGPVAIVNPFGSLEEALEEANRLPFGLSAYAFTKSARNARIISEEIESGTLGINHFNASVPETAFGGVKDSGYGREGGAHGIEAFTVTKTVAHLTL